MASELRQAIESITLVLPTNPITRYYTLGDDEVDAILDAVEVALPSHDLSGNEMFSRGRNSMRDEIKSIINEARGDK